jgi:hypothetical protein
LSFEVSRIILFIHVFCKFIPVQVLPTSSLPLSQVSVGAGLLNVVGMEHAPRLAVVPSGTSNLIAAVLLPSGSHRNRAVNMPVCAWLVLHFKCGPHNSKIPLIE